MIFLFILVFFVIIEAINLDSSPYVPGFMCLGGFELLIELLMVTGYAL